MRPVTFTMGPFAAASANAICLSQTPAAAGPLLLNGATAVGPIAVLDAPRNVVITTTADERGKTFKIEGTGSGGTPIGETLQGVNAGTILSANNFATITAVRISRAAAGAITVGTASPVISPVMRLDDYCNQYASYSLVPSGAANFTVQQTFDDPMTVAAPNWQPSTIAALVGATTTQQGAYPF